MADDRFGGSNGVVFTNVRIIDGSGENPYTGEVAVQGNRIRQVTRGSSRLTPGLGASGGQTVIVSIDAGKHWWRTYFSGVPLTVEPTFTSGRLALVTIVEANPGEFWAYVSSDGGRDWHYHKGFI